MKPGDCDSVAPAKDYPKQNKPSGKSFLEAPGDGCASSQSTTIGFGTVNGNVRGGSERAKASPMPQGHGAGAKKGLREGFMTSLGHNSVGGVAGGTK